GNALTAEQAESERRDTLLRLVAAYRQYNLASGAFFVPKHISARAAQRLISNETESPQWGWQQGLEHSQHLLSVDALAALWHLPPSQMIPDLALVDHRRARSLLIPPEVA